MRLPPDQVRDVRRGRKTQLTVRAQGRCPYKLGHDYAVQAITYDEESGAPQISPELLRVRVVAVWRALVCDLSSQDAQREGFESLEDFHAWWQQRYTKRLDLLAWVVVFEPMREERTRFLTWHGAPDYTNTEARAMRDEPEPVDDFVLAEQKHDANSRWESGAGERLEQRRSTHSLAERLAAIEHHARMGGTGKLRTDLAVIEQRLDRAERKLERAQAAA